MHLLHDTSCSADSLFYFWCCFSLSGTQILSVCKSSPCLDPTVSRSYWPVCHLPIIFITEGLFTSLLALINSLVTLQSSGVCSVLVYLDPSLSLLAVITMIATNVPQVRLNNSLLVIHFDLRSCCNSWWCPCLAVQVGAPAAPGFPSTHFCDWPDSQNFERSWSSGRARPAHLAVEWKARGGFSPCALLLWLSSSQVKSWKSKM